MLRWKNWKVGQKQEVRKNWKIKLQSKAESRDYRNLLSSIETGPKQDKKLEVQVFLVRLLALLSFANMSRFCLLETLALGLTVGLVIGEAESICKEVVVGLSEWLRWKVLMSLRRCSIAKADSQVFSSSG